MGIGFIFPLAKPLILQMREEAGGRSIARNRPAIAPSSPTLGDNP
jgi:hypothetical protein